MIGIEFKSFIISKREKVAACQDSFAINLANGRFAIADGVSNSYHPEYVAQKLCRDFVCERFSEISIPTLLDGLYEEWDSRSTEFEVTLPIERRERALSRKNSKPPGAATFAFLHVNCLCGVAEYHILGDSSIIVFPQEGNPVFLNSKASRDENGNQVVVFDNYPMCICANGAYRGDIKQGMFPLKPGYVVLATDAVTEWIYESQDTKPDLLETLWGMEDNEAFSRLATDCRDKGSMEDDLTLLILRMERTLYPYIRINYAFEFPPVSVIEGLYPLPSLLLPAHSVEQDEGQGMTEDETRAEKDHPSDKEKSTRFLRRIIRGKLWK